MSAKFSNTLCRATANSIAVELVEYSLSRFRDELRLDLFFLLCLLCLLSAIDEEDEEDEEDDND